MRRRKSGTEEHWLMSYADLITNLLLFFVALVTAANISKTKMQQITKALSGAETPASLESIKKQIDKRIEEKNLKDVVNTQLTDEGLKMSLNSGVVFDSGKAEIRAEYDNELGEMLSTLVPDANKYNVAVEGHTDSQPIIPGGPFA